MYAVRPIAPIKSVMYRSPSPKNLYTYSPGICALPNGRLIGTMDMGGSGVINFFPESVPNVDHPWHINGQVFISDDKGSTWQKKADFPFYHARPFVAGNSIYILGHRGDLQVIRSDDNGETWSKSCCLTHGERWHQAPANVIYVGDYVYLVMERVGPLKVHNWCVRALIPILMRANIHDDLTLRESWTFADSFEFQDVMKYEETDYFGIPFYSLEREEAAEIGPKKNCAPIGWLETNVVHIEDPKHIWYDPSGHTFHLFMRAHTGRTNYCCVAQVRELSDGTMKTSLIKTPSGKTLLYMPMPGGQMKFHILYDDKTKYYWLLSTQATDSMVSPDRMPPDRFGIPDNERHRLQLHFSTNCVDWCFAAMVDIGETPLCSRHYASMCISGDSLFILSRSGDLEAASAHNGDMITLHEIEQFRDLIY